MDGWTLSCVATRASRSPPIKGRTNQRPWSVSHSGRHSVSQWAVTAAIVVCRRRSDTRIVVGWFFSNLPPFKQKPRNQKREKKSNQKVLHLNGRPKRFVIFCRHFTHILVNYHGWSFLMKTERNTTYGPLKCQVMTEWVRLVYGLPEEQRTATTDDGVFTCLRSVIGKKIYANKLYVREPTEVYADLSDHAIRQISFFCGRMSITAWELKRIRIKGLNSFKDLQKVFIDHDACEIIVRFCNPSQHLYFAYKIFLYWVSNPLQWGVMFSTAGEKENSNYIPTTHTFRFNFSSDI